MVYFIQQSNEDVYKIGYTQSNDCTSRLSSIQTGNPYPLSVYKSVRDAEQSTEKFFHDYFKNRRLSGEWFSITASEIDKAISFYKTRGQYYGLVNAVGQPITIPQRVEHTKRVFEIIKGDIGLPDKPKKGKYSLVDMIDELLRRWFLKEPDIDLNSISKDKFLTNIMNVVKKELG